jgi:flagellar biosynthetic protein FlhB
MADENDAAEKTEDPTQKRLDDAHDRGDVAKSQEVNTWFMIAGATLVLSTFSGSIGGGILMPLRNLLANAWMIHADGPGLLALSQSLGVALIAALGVPLLMLMIAAIAGNMVQHRLVWSGESLKPKLSKISPLAGAKRVFGKQAAANFAKGVFKVAALGAVMTAILWPERHRLDAMVRFDPAAILGVTMTLTLQLLGAVVALLALVAIADYFFQYRQWFERQKMSLREMKEEFKQSEGDPHIKGRIRQLRHARMKKRMMAAVPKASVIITNPTHYAVALSYDRGMSAPVCVAKGVDTIALKIREVAKAHDIPIVENVALARALHATVQIDDEIPVEHYHAVAEIIGYVMGLKRGLSSGRRV